MARRPHRRLTDAEREARRRADRERLEEAARALLSSEGWQRWVRVRATNGLARYSLGNQLLIALQRPDATYVAGFRAFLDLNRCVRRGDPHPRPDDGQGARRGGRGDRRGAHAVPRGGGVRRVIS